MSDIGFNSYFIAGGCFCHPEFSEWLFSLDSLQSQGALEGPPKGEHQVCTPALNQSLGTGSRDCLCTQIYAM